MMIDEIDDLLYRLARWSKQDGSVPSTRLQGTLAKAIMGTHGPGQRGHIPRDIELADQAMAFVRLHDPLGWKVARLRYWVVPQSAPMITTLQVLNRGKDNIDLEDLKLILSRVHRRVDERLKEAD